MLRPFVLVLVLAASIPAAELTPIAVAELKRDKRIDFSADVLPLFRKSCLACHNATDAKGDLVLETPATILKGGESGASVIPGQATNSLLLKLAAHHVEPIMPPKNNKADAKPFSPDELGLVKLWIDQGATGIVANLPPIRWQALSENLNPILSAAITPDGQFAACGRGNFVDLYEGPTLRFLGSLIDPELKATDRDLIESLAFSPDGQLLASGSDRSVKLWRLQQPAWKEFTDTNVFASGEIPTNKVDLSKEKFTTISADKKRLAAASDSGIVKLYNAGDGKLVAELKGDRREQEIAAREERSLNFAKSEVAYRKNILTEAEKHQKAEVEALKKVADAKAAADKALAEKNEAAKKSTEAKAAAQKVLTDSGSALAQANENKNLSEKLIATAEAAAKSAAASATEAASIHDRAKDNRESAYNEIVALAKADKAAEAQAAIDRALVLKLSFEHAEKAKATAEKAANEAAVNVKSAQENKAKAEKFVADLTNQQKDADTKFKASEKALADADAAVKTAETAAKNATTNLEGTQAVAKKADESVVEAKKLLADSEDAEKKSATALEAAKKRATDSEKKTLALGFAGSWLVVASEDSTLRFFSAETGRPGPVQKFDKPIASLAGDTNSLYVATADQKILATDLTPTWKLERSIGDGSEKSPVIDRVLALEFSADGKLLVTGGGEPTRSGELKIWNVADGSLLREIKDAHSDTVYSARFSPDQKYLATGAADKLMKVFEVASGKFIRSFEGHTHHVLNVSWMRHGRTLASAGAEGVVKTWDFASGEQKKSFPTLNKEITALQYLDPGPEAFAASGDNQLRLLKEDGGASKSYGGATGYTQAAAITTDGKWLVAGGNDSEFRLWDGSKGDLLKSFPAPKRGPIEKSRAAQ